MASIERCSFFRKSDNLLDKQRSCPGTLLPSLFVAADERNGDSLLPLLGHSLAGADSGDESILTAAVEKLGLAGGSALLGDLSSLLVDDVHLEGSANNQDISLVVGKRISKDIYVGYDVNMFSQVGEFWIRYSLKHGFSVETHSSLVSTCGDLLFTFEK